jgi:hypothetical protein
MMSGSSRNAALKGVAKRLRVTVDFSLADETALIVVHELNRIFES